MLNLIKKIFGTSQSRKIKKFYSIVKQVNFWDEKFQSLSDEELTNKTAEFKQRYREGQPLDDLLPEAFGVVKNICRRLCGTEIHVSGYNQKWDMVPYDVQILGAVALHKGCIAEMQTGEGKTLTAAMPLYLNALTSKPVHLVTVNDYLAKRDCEWIGTIFHKLGLTTASLTNDVSPYERKEIYEKDIVYGTASEFGFDYLRDNSMASQKTEQSQRGHYFAIVDEIDSILIDEARTPLIISGPAPSSKQMYDELKDGVSQLVRIQRDFCNHLATEAKKIIDKHDLFNEKESAIKLAKEAEAEVTDAFRKLWLVSKGTPRNKILKRIKENPDLRARVEYFETYFYSEQNKQEKAEELAKLYIIIDERANEFELTDKGIQEWTSCNPDKTSDDFIMLDLGFEYAKIDNLPALSAQEKIAKKTLLGEEDSKRKERSHNLRQLFRAHLLMEKDVDYIIENDKIIIIDENTGRPQPGRRFSDGLHQAIEAKENVSIQKETQTYATITLQNFFRMYEKLAGMTGTAITEANEFKEIYKLEVLEIPTYCPCIRKDLDDKIFMTEREKYNAIIKEIKEVNSLGRPILIGTESVEISEKLSRILKQNKLLHTVLNAKNHSREAEIIAEAGKLGSITIATNMAGRGTDIKLSKEIKDKGGLHVIGTTRHHSRRIDRQLRGRSGRLGDPGSSQFFVSFEDSLMRLFASPRLTSMLQKFRPPEGEPISAKVLNKSIETAQKRIEQRNYNIRKYTLEYDDVMNKQRQEIYSFRNELLSSDNPKSLAHEILCNVCAIIAESVNTSYCLLNQDTELNTHVKEEKGSNKWSAEKYSQSLISYFPVTFSDEEKELFLNAEGAEKVAAKKIIDTFETKLKFQKDIISQTDSDETRVDNLIKEVIRSLLIRKIDELWQDHLLSIDHLRTEVSLRVIGQKDPLVEFKHEAFYLFDIFSKNLQLSIAKDLFRFGMTPIQHKLKDTILHLQQNQSFLPQEEDFTPMDVFASQRVQEEDLGEKPKPVVVSPKIGRNEFCPCGSGKKHKKCCGKLSSSSSLEM